MKLLTTLEIVIIIIVLVVGVLFILWWLGIISPDWFKKMSVKNSFCSEIIQRTNCINEVKRFNEIGITENDFSNSIKNKDIGVTDNPENQARYRDICDYLGYKNKEFKECLSKVCGCRFAD
jgi:hypothetical protein